MREVVLVKLGGSLITDKRGRERVRAAVLRRLAAEIAGAPRSTRRGLVVGHGSGSFGHVAAASFGLGLGSKISLPRLRAAAATTQDRAAVLHRQVIAALRRAGALPFSLAPSSFHVASNGRPVTRLDALEAALELGLLPVVYGDVVMDRARGASIASTETVFLALVRGLARDGIRVRRALWLGETPGVLDERGRTIPRLRAAEVDALSSVGGAAGTDVTGGMRHRLAAAAQLARLGVTSWILDGRVPGRLAQALRGAAVPGTRLVAER